MTPVTRAELLDRARVFELREAVVAAIAPIFADVEVKPHPGKLDISEVIKGDVFTTPSIRVAATRVTPDPRLSQAEDMIVDLTAYVIAADLMVAGRRVEREEMALAICEGLLIALGDDDFTRWTLDDIAPPDDAQFAPLFTAKDFTKGLAYYAVTWRQTLHAVAAPLFGPRYETEPQL